MFGHQHYWHHSTVWYGTASERSPYLGIRLHLHSELSGRLCRHQCFQANRFASSNGNLHEGCMGVVSSACEYMARKQKQSCNGQFSYVSDII